MDGDGDLAVVSTFEFSWFENRLAGDVNDDGEVGIEDFLSLSANFGEAELKTLVASLKSSTANA